MSASTKAFVFLMGMLLVVVWVWSIAHPHPRSASPQMQLAKRTGFFVDLNTADAATLELLPGVGASIAHNIIEARENGTVFERAEDLEPVKFIGPSLISRVGPWVSSGQVRLGGSDAASPD